MEDQLSMVKQFHQTFNVHIEQTPTGQIPKDVSHVRLQILQEEIDEYRLALEKKDIVLVADALTDMLYVLLGTYFSHGLQNLAVELFNEVHRSNMSKLDENGRPIFNEVGKVIKSNQFSKPDLKAIIDKFSANKRL